MWKLLPSVESAGRHNISDFERNPKPTVKWHSGKDMKNDQGNKCKYAMLLFVRAFTCV